MTIQMKAIEQSFPVVLFIMLYKMVPNVCLLFANNLGYDHSNWEGSVCYIVQDGYKKI